MPELEEPRIEHDENAADIARAAAVEVERARGVLKYFADGPSPSRSRNRIATSASKKSLMARGCRPSSAPSSAPADAAIAEFGEHAKLDRGEENLGRPEGECRLENGTGIELRVCFVHGWAASLHVRYIRAGLTKAWIVNCAAKPDMIKLFRGYWAANVAITAVQFVPVVSARLPLKDPVADAIAASFAARELPVSCCANANGAMPAAVPVNVAGSPTAENISSFELAVATVGEVAVEPLPDTPAVRSSGFVVLRPLYS